MSRLTDLLAQTRELDPKLASELEKAVRSATNQRNVGLVFERHLPDSVELPSRPVRKGDTVRILPPRGSSEAGDSRLWSVTRVTKNQDGHRVATLVRDSTEPGDDSEVVDSVKADDLVVVARLDDTIYPGLVQTGEVIRSEDPEAPFHTVINAENQHALNLLTYTHRHQIDCIYIDPPYNTGAKDWKYNNDYVDGEDQYRHSKWLSFMERRLLLAKELLNPDDSVLIVTIDEKEYLRLGMLLEQTFPEARIQMVSSLISPKGSARTNALYRVDEYIFLVQLGKSSPLSIERPGLNIEPKREKAPSQKVDWESLMRRGSKAHREDRPSMFYPIYVDLKTRRISRVGDTVPPDKTHYDYSVPDGQAVAWPIRTSGREGRWMASPETLKDWIKRGFVRVNNVTATGKVTMGYLPEGKRQEIAQGRITQTGTTKYGYPIYEYTKDSGRTRRVRTQWNVESHNSSEYGSSLLNHFVESSAFDFPKSLYAVEDTLAIFVKNKPSATVLDFFSGSGTTAHAVMRLNKQDGGKRRSISVTNNEVSFEEAKALTKAGYRPGDPEWEKLGICDYVTKPRIEAAITGRTPEGDPVKGDYKFTDEFPMSDGFEANARFFSLTYEPPTRVRHGRAFDRIAPLLWLRAGQFGRVIEKIPERGWDVAESHGVIQRLSDVDGFAKAVREMGSVNTVYIVANDDLAFQSAVSSLEGLDVDFVQLYSSYLTNFSFTNSREGI